MKSTEIVQEGPFLNKLASAVKGAGAGYRSNQGRRVADEATAASAKRAHTRWNAQESALIGKGVKPEQLPGYLDRYIQTHFDPQQTGSMKSFPKFSGAYNDATVLAHLTKAVQQLATSELDNPTPTAPAASAPTPAATETPPAATETPPAATETPPAEPTTPAAPAANPAHAMFKDPTAFKAEWDKFVASKPNYRLIADPALLSVLKNMWMRTGGMKAESKKNKGNRV